MSRFHSLASVTSRLFTASGKVRAACTAACRSEQALSTCEADIRTLGYRLQHCVTKQPTEPARWPDNCKLTPGEGSSHHLRTHLSSSAGAGLAAVSACMPGIANAAAGYWK